ILLAMGIIPLQLVQKRFVDYGNKLLKASVTVNNILTAGIRNLFLLRIYNLTESEAKKGREALSLQRALFVKHSFFSSFGAALPTLLGVIIISIVSVISHYGTQTPAHVLISFFYIFLRLAQS